MSVPLDNSFNVNSDFRKYFKKNWSKSKAGKSLIMAYATGSEIIGNKKEFFRKNKFLHYEIKNWKECKKITLAIERILHYKVK